MSISTTLCLLPTYLERLKQPKNSKPAVNKWFDKRATIPER